MYHRVEFRVWGTGAGVVLRIIFALARPDYMITDYYFSE
jgi:hypothetical protein